LDAVDDGGSVQTRKDLYQAHRLMMQRVSLALLQGEPDMPESPMRRFGVATFAGVMVAVLVAAGFGVWGLLRGGGATSLEKAGMLLIEKETGTKYAFSERDHKLIPFLNYTSARLAMEGEAKQRVVSRKSLAKYDRGPVVGIVGAPDTLPDPKSMARGRWSLCVRRTANGQGVQRSAVSLVGGREVGGRPLGDGQAVVVRAGDQVWLVWNDRRMRVPSGGERVLTADQPVEVTQNWLNGLPAGPDFKAPDIPHLGDKVDGPGGSARVGQVYVVRTGAEDRWYVQLADGLASIYQTEGVLLLGDPAVKDKAYGGELARELEIDPAAAAARPSPTQVHNAGLPATTPKAERYDPMTPLCAVYSGTDQRSLAARLTIGGTLPALTTTAVAQTATPTSAGPIDQVVLPGGGTLAGTLATSGQSPQAYSVVTDQGFRFPLQSSDEVAKLGYKIADAAPVPANLLRLIPEGPALDPVRARTPVATALVTPSPQP
jgi:type VII secretion protein EccB